MKVLYLVHQFYPEYQTGTENIIFNIASMGQKYGNQVKVVTYSFYDDSFYDREDDGILSKEFIYHGIPVLAFKYKYPPADLNIALENQLLLPFAKKILNSEAPDLVHVGHSMRVHGFIRAATIANIPYIITLTDFFLLCPKVILAPNDHSLCSGPNKGTSCSTLCKELPDGVISTRMRFAGEILRNSKGLITPTNFVAKIYQREFDNLNLHVINHGIRYKYIKQNNKMYGSGDRLTFGYAGSLIYHKGVHILLKAFSAIDQQDVRLAIYGSGQDGYENKLKQIAGNDQRVSFYGKYAADQLGEIFNQIDVLITPSICYETYSLVLHEALASNVPVLASNLGGMAEAINDGINGYKFEPGISDDLQRKMSRIIDNPHVINEIKNKIKTDLVIPSVEQEAYSYFKIYVDIYQKYCSLRNSV